MPKSYSGALRERVIEAVETGASQHEAADRFEISVSSAVRWPQCRFRTDRITDSCNRSFQGKSLPALNSPACICLHLR